MKGLAMEQHAERNTAKKHRNIPLRLAMVLLCLILASSCYYAGVLARYTTAVTSSDTARVAKFLITEEIDGETFQFGVDSVSIAPGEEEQKAALLGITNSSEVAVKYTITVKNETENLPVDISINDLNTSTGKKKIGSNTVTFETELSPGDGNQTYQLNLKWQAGKSGTEALAYMGMVDYFSITAEAVQID